MEVDLVDLERGEMISPTSTEIPISPTVATEPYKESPDEEHIDTVTGQTGCSRRKQYTREWMFFPACERQISLVLDYLAADLWAIQKELEDLESRNRSKMGLGYQMHRPGGDFGEKKGVLMEKLITGVERYFRIFNNGIAVMNQASPTTRTVDDFRAWACTKIAPDPSDPFLCAKNYRVLGQRPSVIDNMMHSVIQVVAERYSQHFSKTDEVEMVNLDYAMLSMIAHVLIISFALCFLLLPLTVVYLLELGKGLSVVVVVIFCLCFCLVFFVFGQLNTDHKFIMLFTYTGVMATLLSNLENRCAGN
ncbi:hypothetical protein OQA88_7569 [Cercophora sp. LCS_1]